MNMNKKVLVSALMVVSLFLQPLTAFGAFTKLAPIVQVGQLNVSVSPLTRVASNIQAGTNGAELATFDFVAVRENILIRKIGVQIGGSVDVTKIKNGRLVDNQGRIVFGPIVNGNGLGFFTFVGNLTVQRNSRLSLKFLADVNQDAANGATVRAYIPAAASFLAIGGASGNRIQPTGIFPVTGRTMRIVNQARMAVSFDSSFSNQTYIAPSLNVVLARFVVQAPADRDIELRQLRVKIDGFEGLIAFESSDGRQLFASVVPSPDGFFGGELHTYKTIRRNGMEVITVKANTSFAGEYRVSIDGPADVGAVGLPNGEVIQAVGNFPVSGPQISIINGTLNVTAGNLAGQAISVGQDRTLAAFDFTAVTSEDIMIHELKLNFAGNPALISSVKIVRQDTNELLYQGSIVGGQLDAVFFNANVIVPKGGRLTLVIKGDVTDQFINPADNNRAMSFSIQSANDIEVMGMASGMLLNAQGNFPILGPVMTLPAPVIADNDLRVSLSGAQLGGRLVAGINTLAAFDLGAGSEPLQIRNLKVKLASNNFANIRNVTFVIKSGMDEQVVYSGVPTMLGANMAEVGGALNIDLGEYSTKTLLVRAEIVMVNMGDVIQVQIERAEDISAFGMISAEFADVQGIFPMRANAQTF